MSVSATCPRVGDLVSVNGRPGDEPRWVVVVVNDRHPEYLDLVLQHVQLENLRHRVVWLKHRNAA